MPQKASVDVVAGAVSDRVGTASVNSVLDRVVVDRAASGDVWSLLDAGVVAGVGGKVDVTAVRSATVAVVAAGDVAVAL